MHFENIYLPNVGSMVKMYNILLSVDKLEEQGYYRELKALVEEMYAANGRTPVTLVVHSMGGPVSLYFLNNIVSQSWKDTYIHAYVPIAAAWDGGLEALEIIVSGFPEWVEALIHSRLREILKDVTRSFQSVFWMLPSPLVCGNNTIVQIGSVNYTANDFEALFQRIGIPEGYVKYNNVAPLVDGWRAPNVSTFCYYGLRGSDSTPEGFIYNERDFPNSRPIARSMGDGDEVVNRKILEICLKWAEEQSATFNSRTFTSDHRGILSDDNLLAAIHQIVTIPQECTTTEAPTEKKKKGWSWWG